MEGITWRKEMRKMRKILIISTVGLIYDGITSVILQYLQSMNLEDMDVYVLGTIDVKPNIRSQIENLGCKIVEFPNRREKTISYFFSLVKYIKKNNIDVIHVHGNSATLAIEMIAGWIGGCKKRIAHSHNTKCNQIKADKILRPLFNYSYTDGLACSEDAGRWLFGNRKFEILTNGRNLEEYIFNKEKRQVIRDSYGIEDEIVIGHVGGFFEQKNHKFLVEVYKQIKNLEPNSKFFMIGEGVLKSEIEELCKDLDVIFTGAIDNVPDYLNAMDGMLLPSFFEGLPLVSIEWQINGLPCVLSDSITKDCKLTECITFLSLDEAAYKWADMIINKIKNNQRELCANLSYKTIEKSTFNIRNSSKKLERIYRCL